MRKSDVVPSVAQAKLAGDNERFVSSGISALTNALNFLNNKVIAENVFLPVVIFR